EDPRRHGGLELERPGPAPDHEHRIVQDFLDQLRPLRPLLEEAAHPGAVTPIQRLERGNVATRDLREKDGVIGRFPLVRSGAGTRLTTFGYRHQSLLASP